MNLRYDGESPFKKLAEIEDVYKRQVSYCFLSNDSKHDTTNYNPYVNNGKTVRTQMDFCLLYTSKRRRTEYIFSTTVMILLKKWVKVLIRFLMQ